MSSEEWNREVAGAYLQSAIFQVPPGWSVLLKGSEWQPGSLGAIHRSPSTTSRRVLLQVDLADSVSPPPPPAAREAQEAPARLGGHLGAAAAAAATAAALLGAALLAAKFGHA